MPWGCRSGRGRPPRASRPSGPGPPLRSPRSGGPCRTSWSWRGARSRRTGPRRSLRGGRCVPGRWPSGEASTRAGGACSTGGGSATPSAIRSPPSGRICIGSVASAGGAYALTSGIAAGVTCSLAGNTATSATDGCVSSWPDRGSVTGASLLIVAAGSTVDGVSVVTAGPRSMSIASRSAASKAAIGSAGAVSAGCSGTMGVVSSTAVARLVRVVFGRGDAFLRAGAACSTSSSTDNRLPPSLVWRRAAATVVAHQRESCEHAGRMSADLAGLHTQARSVGNLRGRIIRTRPLARRQWHYPTKPRRFPLNSAGVSGDLEGGGREIALRGAYLMVSFLGTVVNQGEATRIHVVASPAALSG